MRIARVLLLVLLAVMLPVRGVMAAAMLCPPAASVDADDYASTTPAHAEGCADHDGGTGKVSCNHCSACCSVPPLASAAPVLPLPHEQARAPFPSFAAPAPVFQSEGQERPPRSV